MRTRAAERLIRGSSIGAQRSVRFGKKSAFWRKNHYFYQNSRTASQIEQRDGSADARGDRGEDDLAVDCWRTKLCAEKRLLCFDCIFTMRKPLFGLFEGTRHQCEVPGRITPRSLCVGEHWMLHLCPYAPVELARLPDTTEGVLVMGK